MDVSAAAPVLTSALAQEIAGDTSSIIGFNVLITDRDGTVIGSGDRSRVGTFHEASVEVMSTLRPAAHSAAQARNLRGVRPGITLPIVLGATALGTPPDPGEATARLALLQPLRATFPGTHDIVAAMPSDRFVVLHRIPPARHGEGRGDDLPALSRRAVEEIGRRYRLTAAAGIGDVATTVVELHESYQDASIALRLGARLGTHGNVPPTVSSIDDLRIHQLLAAVGHRP